MVLSLRGFGRLTWSGLPFLPFFEVVNRVSDKCGSSARQSALCLKPRYSSSAWPTPKDRVILDARDSITHATIIAVTCAGSSSRTSCLSRTMSSRVRSCSATSGWVVVRTSVLGVSACRVVCRVDGRGSSQVVSAGTAVAGYPLCSGPWWWWWCFLVRRLWVVAVAPVAFG